MFVIGPPRLRTCYHKTQCTLTTPIRNRLFTLVDFHPHQLHESFFVLMTHCRWVSVVVRQTHQHKKKQRATDIPTSFKYSSCYGCSTISQWTHNAIITSLLCQNDVATSFWRNNDVIIASWARGDGCTVWLIWEYSRNCISLMVADGLAWCLFGTRTYVTVVT